MNTWLMKNNKGFDLRWWMAWRYCAIPSETGRSINWDRCVPFDRPAGITRVGVVRRAPAAVWRDREDPRLTRWQPVMHGVRTRPSWRRHENRWHGHVRLSRIDQTTTLSTSRGVARVGRGARRTASRHDGSEVIRRSPCVWPARRPVAARPRPVCRAAPAKAAWCRPSLSARGRCRPTRRPTRPAPACASRRRRASTSSPNGRRRRWPSGASTIAVTCRCASFTSPDSTGSAGRYRRHRFYSFSFPTLFVYSRNRRSDRYRWAACSQNSMILISENWTSYNLDLIERHPSKYDDVSIHKNTSIHFLCQNSGANPTEFETTFRSPTGQLKVILKWKHIALVIDLNWDLQILSRNQLQSKCLGRSTSFGSVRFLMSLWPMATIVYHREMFFPDHVDLIITLKEKFVNLPLITFKFGTVAKTFVFEYLPRE